MAHIGVQPAGVRHLVPVPTPFPLLVDADRTVSKGLGLFVVPNIYMTIKEIDYFDDALEEQIRKAAG